MTKLKTQIVTKFKNSKCDKTQNFKWEKKLKKSKCDKTKTQNVKKHKN